MATRIVLGSIMLLFFATLVATDAVIGAPFPLIHLVFFGATIYGALEIRSLLPPEERSHPVMIVWCLGLVLFAPLVCHYAGGDGPDGGLRSSWVVLGMGVVGALWCGFVGEIAFYRERDHALARLAFLQMSILYLGVPAAVVLQIPKDAASHPKIALTMLGLAVIIPKACDIGAYFTGRFVGRIRITPVLSPKKTLEGFIGGVLLGMGLTLTAHFALPFEVFASGVHALFFGLFVSIAGIFGDLAESLLKRDLHAKDASRLIPGFGGILDVIDSILFGASVALIWFLLFPPPGLAA